MSDEIVISGPELNISVFEGSVAQLLIPKLKSHPKDDIIQVNGETGESQTCEEFLKAGLQVAEGLKQLGVKQGEVIALVANYSSNTFAAALGGVAIGAPIFPINPSFKTWELKNLFDASEPRIVFCEKGCSQYVIEALDLIENRADIYLVDDEKKDDANPRLKKFSSILKDVDVDSYEPAGVKNPNKDPVLIVASSGTTGLPKAVAITHKSINFQLALFQYSPELVTKRPYLQVTHMFWVTGVSALFYCSFAGIKRVYVPNVTGTNLLRAIHNHKPGWVFMAPIFLSWILNHPDFDKYDVSSLTNISTGGSSLPQTTIDLMKKKWPVPVDFCQTYGMTELAMTPSIPTLKDIKSVGQIGPPGTKVKVVDVDSGKTLGPNQIGELRFKHELSMMTGYLKNEEATKLAFDETGFYKSGDLGYYSEDNLLYVVNRIKELIKCKNHQISPTELEDAISSIPDVEDVGVVGVKHEVDQYRPVALVVKKKNSKITEEDIVKYVADKMSKEKQLYGGVKFVESIPRTASGKIQRIKLLKLLEN